MYRKEERKEESFRKRQYVETQKNVVLIYFISLIINELL